MRCDIDAEQLFARRYIAFDRKQTHALKLDQIAAAASQLFNARGIEATSLEDIAAALGAKKAALYNYFESKAELISLCYRRSFEIYERMIDTADKVDGSGIKRIATVLHLHAQAEMGGLTPLRVQPVWNVLSPTDQAALRKTIERFAQSSERMTREAAIDGTARLQDDFFTGSSIAGSMLWVAKLPRDWLPPTPRLIADETTAILVHGIRKR